MEYDKTNKIFTRPKIQATEDYVSGHFVKTGGLNMTKEIISSKDLHLYYGKKEALKGINLSFNQGEITAMIGPSGCGKSTYLRSLNRMNDLIPNVTITGSVLYKDKDIYGPKQMLLN